MLRSILIGCVSGVRPPVPSTWPSSVRSSVVCDESKGQYVLEGADADYDSIADDCNDHDGHGYSDSACFDVQPDDSRYYDTARH